MNVRLGPRKCSHGLKTRATECAVRGTGFQPVGSTPTERGRARLRPQPGPFRFSAFTPRYDLDAIALEIGRRTRGMMYFVHSSSARSTICLNTTCIGSFGRSPQ